MLDATGGASAAMAAGGGASGAAEHTWEHTSPIRTIAQAREREVIVAAAAAPTNTAIMPRVLNALIGTRFRPIIGYDPGAGLTLAVERGEAMPGRCRIVLG